MEDSILKTIRKLIGGIVIEDGESGPFDENLIVHINTAIFILNQLGVGKDDFEVTGEQETWYDFLGAELPLLKAVKDYIYQKVKSLFDAPSSGTLMQVINDNLRELEWRLNLTADRAKYVPIATIESDTDIVLTRGDSYVARIDLYSDDAPYSLKLGDELVFTMKRHYSDAEPLISKVIPSDTLLLKLEPSDTKSLPFGTYIYDIQLNFADGSVSTIVKTSKFVITGEVT